MEEKTIDSMNEDMLTPADFITLMFERTDEDGVLYIPGWHYNRPGWMINAPGITDDNDSYRCKVDWNLSKYERTLKKFNTVYSAIEKIAKYYDELFDSREDAKTVLKDDELVEVWNTYLKELDDGGFDQRKFDEIYDKLDTMEWVKCIAANIAKGERIEDFDKELLTEYMDISVSEEELEYRRKYLVHFHKEAEKRLGSNMCAYDVYTRAWRVCRLLSLRAPEIVINSEARQFAAAFVLHEHGVSREVVDNNIRLRLEKMELMSEEELDELYRPQKTNTRKSLAPLFVYEIILKNSDSKNHLRQNDILSKLCEYPYEISLERKALSRIIHNLSDSPQYAVFQDKTGVWIEQEKRG